MSSVPVFPPSRTSPDKGDGHVGQEGQFSESLGLFEYWLLLELWWPVLLGVCLSVALVTVLVSKLLLTKWYTARAEIASVSSYVGPTDATASVMSGQVLSGSSLLGGALHVNDRTALQFVAILQSVDFLAEVVRDNHLQAVLKLTPVQASSDWQMAQALSKRLDVEYDANTDIINLRLSDPQPEVAQHVLQLILDHLRERLRRQEIQTAGSAVKSLSEAIRVTSDVLLQNRLYDLVAGEIEREKLASADSNFAFNLVEAPVVPNNPDYPRAGVNGVFAIIIAFFLTSAVIVVREWVHRHKRERHLLMLRRAAQRAHD